METVTQYLTTYGLNIIAAVLIFVIGMWVSKFVSRLVGKLVAGTKVDTAIVNFVQALCYIALLAFVIIAALSRLGIQTTSFIVVIGAAGLAIGLALQGSLANFAAGVLLLMFKPFKVGDFIEAAGQKGTVKQIQIFNTILDTLDNIRVIMPNSKVTGDSILNLTTNGTRRVDLCVRVSYSNDLHKAKEAIEHMLIEDSRILKDPYPAVAVSELGESGVNFVVRPWVKCEDYWDVYFDVTEKIKHVLDENGITIPFPQRAIHIEEIKSRELVGAMQGEKITH